MRICRFRLNGNPSTGFYSEEAIIPLAVAVEAYRSASGERLALEVSDNLLDYLPPDGRYFVAARELAEFVAAGELPADARLAPSQVELLVPVPRPNKLFLLAGNYAKHIEEGGRRAEERRDTFPYVFMKPPQTTLTHPGDPVRIPAVSPGAIDWELELGVVIGRRCKGVSEADALSYVAGYTVVNDISDRRFRPNPDRKKREQDGFFDWLHGKWHDTFCPMGPCVVSADDVPDPQTLPMRLTVNGEVKQQASTADMIFPVAAVIEFISSFVTLEPGDVISTGTPSGVGATSGTFLKAGDRLAASIEGIGVLSNPVV